MNTSSDFEELVERFLEECRGENAPDVEDFIAKHPQHAAALRELLPLVVEMEGLRNCKIHEESPEDAADSDSPFSKRSSLERLRNTSQIPSLPNSDYQLLRKIGNGGMGVVFEARQRSLDRKVAVKILSPLLVPDARQRQQFEQEARVIAMLHHPNIVKVISAGSEAGYCYYAMELIEGKGLNECEFESLRDLAKVGLQAARALAYAHSCKVLHRDIKPANMLLDANHELRVSDFGIACVLSDEHDLVERSGSQCGTLRYMAPERLTSGVNSFATDQYSLGISLYELAIRSPVLSTTNPRELISQICEGKIPPLECHDPDFSAIINKSISVRPEDRYASMDELAEDLQHFLNHEPIIAVAVSPFRRLKLWIRRKPLVAALSAVSILCAIAFVAALIIGLLRTGIALELAKKNAFVADVALTNVFEHIETQIPSQSGTQLLEKLIPYYQYIASSRNLPPSRVADALEIIGAYALRAGDFPLAEKVFRDLATLRPTPLLQNQLSEALRRQGKKDEADALSREIVERYADSKDPAARFEAVRALLALSAGDKTLSERTLSDEEAPESPELKQAFQIIHSLLKTDPKNPEYRFQYALLLGANPRLFRSARIAGVEPNAIALLNELAEEYPNRPDYGLALIDIMHRKLRSSQRVRSRDQEALVVAMSMSDRLLGRFPNTPEVVSSVVRFREAYIGVLRKTRSQTESRRETERLLGTLELLHHNTEAPESVQECLLRLQLQRLEMAVRDRRTQDCARLSDEIRDTLEKYHGPSREEFLQRLESLQ
ncbi:MAG: protein kinase [Planctomycetia bacterium]|nr:protein kinase [Planctomycetia bacterium]